MFRGFVIGVVVFADRFMCLLFVGFDCVVSWLVCDGLGRLMVWVWCDISCGFVSVWSGMGFLCVGFG